MGADNWTFCPKCERKNRIEKEKTLAKALATYGKVSPEEYERVIFFARKGLENEIIQPFREDYDIGLIGDEFAITYRGSCVTCKFTYSFQFQKTIGG